MFSDVFGRCTPKGLGSSIFLEKLRLPTSTEALGKTEIVGPLPVQMLQVQLTFSSSSSSFGPMLQVQLGLVADPKARASLNDLYLWVLYGGQERKVSEYAKLLAAEGPLRSKGRGGSRLHLGCRMWWGGWNLACGSGHMITSARGGNEAEIFQVGVLAMGLWTLAMYICNIQVWNMSGTFEAQFI